MHGLRREAVFLAKSSAARALPPSPKARLCVQMTGWGRDEAHLTGTEEKINSLVERLKRLDPANPVNPSDAPVT